MEDSKDLPKVVRIRGKIRKSRGTGAVAIAAPKLMK